MEEIKLESPEEIRIAELARKELGNDFSKHEANGAIFYLITNDSGGVQFDSIEDAREYVEEEAANIRHWREAR